MGPTGGRYRVLQIHPTLRCNLRCLHCYSSSGPERRGDLDIDLLHRALFDAGQEGYTVAGFSGGEPILYRPLRRALEQARACGMITTVTSNGMLLGERQLEMLQGAVDLLAISLDGPPASHNLMRSSPRAFEGMLARLDGVRASGIPFGFIFTLTRHNLHELEWAARFALEQGARLLQIHPLEMVGRARERLPQSHPGAVELAHAFMETHRIQAAMGDRLTLHLDVLHMAELRARPERVFADGAAPDLTAPLADLVSPLVIDRDGTVLPIQHSFDRAHALGRLQDASLSELAARWKRERYEAFRALCRRVLEEIAAPASLPFVNWYEVVGRRAESAP